MNRYMKSVIGAMIGCSTAGWWLLVDLLLPDPIGDYLLFILMGLVNMVIGWQVAKLVGKTKEASKISNERTEAKFELES
ncbi:hypothetical protein WD019_06635 [Fictibacillus sp. Mic-4]|uniref:hypothetical protein n=1 Tax=Fictibacillus sp. Mic-4 TaxID=3132826 RepID=UPI003CEFEB6A